MDRRKFLKAFAATSLIPSALRQTAASSIARPLQLRRVRPGDEGWPTDANWQDLNAQVGGRLIKVEWPLARCSAAPGGEECAEVLKQLKNPYYIGDQPGLTQTSGWVDAWTSTPSPYAVAAQHTKHVVSAVNFARQNNLRLVIKGGGHSYQGTSNGADSLLIWTRAMNDIVLHGAFVGKCCEGKSSPQPAVSIGAGSIWMHTYDEVVTKGGRYVQGGGCATVGVAGLIQSGGFGSFSKYYGLAAAGLIEAEVVIADGSVRVANRCTNPDLFWAVKGGGGGSFGVITRLTLRTRDLPEFFGGVIFSIMASSDVAYRKLLEKLVTFYKEKLFNPHWGEQIIFGPQNKVRVQMLFSGLSETQARTTWRTFLDWVSSSPDDFIVNQPILIKAIPARSFWDPQFWKKNAPEFVVSDERPGAPERNIFWVGDRGEAGQFLHAYKSAWLPSSLLHDTVQQRLARALFESSRHWSVSLHFNKGLAGAPLEEIESARDTAMNPAALDAFALAICASAGPPPFKGIQGHSPDIAEARENARLVGKAMEPLLKIASDGGSYVSESDYFEREWQKAFWGTNYPRLAAIKKKYDPKGLFAVHHGVGSEEWTG